MSKLVLSLTASSFFSTYKPRLFSSDRKQEEDLVVIDFVIILKNMTHVTLSVFKIKKTTKS